ncbi:tetratricopeptide repeat protein [Chitinophaga barathri]|uniref:Tetratricopeptide repeat protein n=1 Tax=Chitinophaga barathri TaxID=1647451 RepID=A0A3N4MST3_9BACT|nr:tetratricopeptide repeat protein [Chitinophaga barathri]RPD38473.1 tetratricopeptide repeat protein [Chitinophaga barathri]
MTRSIRHSIQVLLCCLLTGTALKVQAHKDPILFAEGNQLYQQKKYEEAAAKYQQLIDSGYQVADLYFNAGNAYYKSNQTAMAVYSFEKALHLKPGDEAIEQNLALANQRVGSNIETLPLLFFEKWWLKWQQLHSGAGWAVWSIVWFWLLIAAAAVYFFVPVKRRQLFRWAMVLTGVLFIGYFSMAIWMHNKAYNSGEAIVMHNAVKVKSAPDDGSKDLFELKEGVKVKVLDGTSQFSKVQLADGKSGWVAVNELKNL